MNIKMMLISIFSIVAFLLLSGCTERNYVPNHDQSSEAAEAEDTSEIDTFRPTANEIAYAVLVNKKHHLGQEDTPDDLVLVDVPTVLSNPEVNQMRKVAADALKEMFDHASDEGIELYARSGYRSYQTQLQLFKNYAEKNGEDAANRYSARAGESEHQTGLVMDVTSKAVNLQLEEKFGETEEGKWLSANAHHFGFIIRYPKGKEEVTGYIYEPWHIRYLGKELATKVYESDLTYEEFLEREKLVYESR